MCYSKDTGKSLQYQAYTKTQYLDHIHMDELFVPTIIYNHVSSIIILRKD